MTPIDPQWPYWVMSSFNKAIKDRLITTPDGTYPQPAHLFFEGEDLKDIKDALEHVEVRLKGPDFVPEQGNTYSMVVEVNFIISVKKGLKNLYRIHQIGGLCLNAMTSIPLVDLSVPDSETMICTLLARQGAIKYRYWGQVDPKTDLLQAGVSAIFSQTITMKGN